MIDCSNLPTNFLFVINESLWQDNVHTVLILDVHILKPRDLVGWLEAKHTKNTLLTQQFALNFYKTLN